MLRLVALALVALTAPACKRPVETPPAPVVEQPVMPPSEEQPREATPPKPQLTPEILADVQDTVHDLADRALGYSQTFRTYAVQPSAPRVGKMVWQGATAQLSIGGKPVFEVTPRTLPCHATNVGTWRRAWTGKGASSTRLEPLPQWWRFRASGQDAFIRVGATELTAFAFDGTRNCWTAEDVAIPITTRPKDIDFARPAGEAGPGKQEPEVFGKPGKLTVTTSKIDYFDGSARLSFEPSDTSSCAYADWGKSGEKSWFRARFTSGKQAKTCPEKVDDFVQEMIEVRDQHGAIIWATSSWTPGEAAPVGRKTTTANGPLGDALLMYEVADQYGAAEIPKDWNDRCKSVHRDNLREPVIAAGSKRTLVGVWTIRRDNKEIASGVGTRTEVDLDCVPAD